ncbi:hypothetical protein F5X99DRAFT_420026 [Biscogniauxia marginata]|nr:hypothetical protein F5X99DRAFT_420026 [Biscogniauxia marginata]
MTSPHMSVGQRLGHPTMQEQKKHRYELRSNKPDTKSYTMSSTEADSQYGDDILLPPVKRKWIKGNNLLQSAVSVQEEAQSYRLPLTEDNLPIYGASAGLLRVPLGRGSREPTLATDRTRITSVYDGGYQFEQEYLRERLRNESDIELTDYDPLATEDGQSLEDDLHEALVESVFPQGVQEFLPGDGLRKIICLRRVDRLFTDDQPGIELPAPGHDSIGSLICPPLGSQSPSYQRILAILVLLGNDMFKQIGHFIAEGVNDTHLPLRVIRSAEHRTEALTTSSEDETPLRFTLEWKLRHLKGFQKCQWQVRPTFLADKSDDIAHYECRTGQILPFMEVEPTQELQFWGQRRPPSLGETNRGGNSVMLKYRIHESQQNLKRYTTDKASRAVAVKRLQSTIHSDFKNERRMLVRLTPHASPHLSKLLATFETPYISGDKTYSHYYLMFEWADMSLLDLWRRGHPTTIERQTLSQWVAQQCRGLAEALDVIHEFKAHRREFDNESRTHGFHGDIKPENILWYANWSDYKSPFGVLQITDFGLSSFHNTATALDIKARMLDHNYSPPESILARRISQSLDIWTLGCLFLEFAAWLGRDERGRDDFEMKRMTKQSLTGWEQSTFYTVEQLQESTKVAINENVIERDSAGTVDLPSSSTTLWRLS